jgi:hypothetical protein
MRVLLQQINNGLYFKEPGVWTGDAAGGMDFLSSTKAIDYCTANRISGVQLVLKFEEQLYDIVLPMVAERRLHQARPGQVQS